ncbi:hypothetical protein V8B55DRAFT_1464414 [Mucor lusitanicus]|uniref:Uncharacterized protein n=2 Tax=Mucor circinelloides f. lusitanicus TaxID=29924 RepID=A0A168JNM1_MUCCL|nr:hypothetical protein FB192DRAFT_1355072 [Mucor lusitanicus]OAD01416.1 hypothetical protein MUCCIDRAFT_112860 [Mucor lusitanicus CBS 277.49]
MKDTSIEAYTLMSIINRDMDDGDVKNAILLSERLYAIDNSNPQYKFLYAKCLYQSLDYNATYTILKSVQSIPCLNLFAKSCLHLGNSDESDEMQRLYWSEGIQALRSALAMTDLPQKTHWGDELASNTIRHHMPSKASLCNLLGDLYMKLDNIRAASIYYWTCLESNPYKISAYMKLCDIAPDIDFDTAKLPQDIFTNFDPATTDLSRSSQSYLPSAISMNQCDISFSDELPSTCVRKNSWDMPQLKDEYHDTTVDQLRALVRVSSKISEENNEHLDNEFDRGEIEHAKDSIINSIKSDIVQMRANEAYKNKHGLHKKPPVQTPQKLKVDLTLNDENDVNYAEERKVYQSIQQNIPPRLVRKQSTGNLEETVHPRKRVKTAGASQQQKSKSLENFFLPSLHGQYTSDPDTDALIIEGMNRIMKVLCILANGYLRQSFYNCEKAALELQQLDDHQYNSARVLCILGKAYYDAGDYTSARAFFKQAFVIAPWFCECVPIYSTCLWYLEKEKELNLLAFKMKDNKSHLFEAYVAAGNWAKCVKGGNEATQWFQKAVNLDPSRSYGHALLGYEEWEKGNSLGAKQHFSKSMIANKRSYIGWYGMATAYQGMEEYAQARTLLTEAVRLHPRHPIVLATMAEVLCDLELYQEAFNFIERSLSIKSSPSNLKLKEKITQRLQIQEAGNYV